ncbi:MAG TPA: tetratricopeptide repeat protein [Pyrinomonadaceae bacterium]
MKKAFSVVEFSLLTLVLLSPFVNAQSGTQSAKTNEKAAYNAAGGERTDRAGQTNQLNGSGADEAVKPGTSQAAIEAQKLYASAVGLFEAGKLDEAIDVFKQAVKLKPDDPQTHYSLGMVYAQSRSYEEAADSFKRAVKFKPDWAEANFRVGMMAYVLGHHSQSIEAYNKLLKLNSPLANTLYRIINEENNSATGVNSTSRDSSSKTVAVVPVSSSNGDAKNVSVAKESEPAQPSTSPTTQPENRVAEVTPAAKPSVTPAPVSEQSPTGQYRVGVGDILDIRLLNSTIPRSTLYTVVDGGLIDLPIAGGAVSVAGLTTDEIQSRIAGELKRRAVEGNSVVTVGVRQYASHSVIVTGLVANPGSRFLRREAVPLYVIMAEVQPRQDAGRVTIMSAGGEKRIVDLNDASVSGTLVRAGDVITVSAKPQEFYYIAGRVNYPGQKSFQAGITLLQAILAAGGTVRPNDKDIEVSREGADGRLTTTRYKLKDIKAGKLEDPKLVPGDRIEVVH